jgi:hypothetical protein
MNHYGAYYAFLKDLPLNNGSYQDARAVVSNSVLRAWGQKDLVNDRAHLWLQNSRHTWKNVVDAVAMPPVSATVTMTGFKAGHAYKIDWWNTYQADPAQAVISTQTITAGTDGSLTLSVQDLATDVAVKVRAQ